MTTSYLYKVEAPIVGSAVGLFLAFFLLIFCIKKGCYRKSKLNKNVKAKELKRYRFDELKKATNSFGDKNLIGSGAFGDVYRGDLDDDDNRIVAIKRAHTDSNETVEEFRNEVELLSRVMHKNLVGLIGYCAEARHRILVYEYVSQGCLLEYIIGKGRSPLAWQQRLNIAIGSAKGIAHLHDAKPSLIHRDLKPSNILIEDGFEAKISDFGLVKKGPKEDVSHVSTQVKGTPGYMDPAYCSSLHLTTASDVFSFGVILLQLVSACPALDHSRKQSQYHISNWAQPSIESGMIEDILDANLQLEGCNKKVMLKMAQLGIRCTAWEPKNRPTMRQVVKELEEALCRVTKRVSQMPSYLQESQSFSIDSVRLQRFYMPSYLPEYSQSFSINSVHLQKFNVESFDDISVRSASLMCLDVNKLTNSNEEIDGR